jgi:enoyl-CoA hydratase/carnithine racemase
METDVILVDEPAPMVSRITMNRPEKRNALNHALRGAILAHPRDFFANVASFSIDDQRRTMVENARELTLH